MPAQILLIRHGEKPDQGSELSTQGWKRARLLPAMFETRSEFNQLGGPAALYAMAPAKAGGSVRAIQTLKFVSQKYNLAVQADFTKDQISNLVNAIKMNHALDGKMIIICWEHTALIEIAMQLGVNDQLDWPASQFDRVWTLNFSSEAKLIRFQSLPEKVLPTDSQN